MIDVYVNVNHLPGVTERFRMEGLVVKPGPTITVTEGRAYAIEAGREKLVATMGATLMAVACRGIQH